LLLGLLREDKALANRFLRSHAAGVHPQTARAAHGAAGESVDFGGSTPQPRMQTGAGVWSRGSRAPEP
jgi:hypothetical protein